MGAAAARGAGAGGLGTSQANLLRLLVARGKLDVSSAARFMGVGKPAASRALGRMEKKGCVRRARDKEDRRMCWVTITAKGRKILARYDRHRYDAMASLLEAVSAREVGVLSAALRRIIRRAAEQKPDLCHACVQCVAFHPEVCLLDGARCPYLLRREPGSTSGLRSG